ncbi:MAG: hypothetical protein LBL21_01715 [Rickettsiales bacterium]|nr:hypothetical protein [Rickettsiales bacterium]
MSKIEYDIINARQCRSCGKKGAYCNSCKVMIAHKKKQAVLETVACIIATPFVLGYVAVSEIIDTVREAKRDKGR